MSGEEMTDAAKATTTGEAAREAILGEDAASVPGGVAGRPVRPRKAGKTVCAVCGLAPGTCAHPASMTTVIPGDDDDAEEAE